LGLPLLPPSKAKNATFHRGANFAITGATSLDMPFFEARGLEHAVWSSGSLHTQIKWFQDLKPKICSSPQGPYLHIARRHNASQILDDPSILIVVHDDYNS
jgi:hypothetical protein